MEIVALLSLGRSIDEEAPRLAVDLGLTAYEVGIMLRAPMPVIVLRTDDRNRSIDVLSKLRSRGHDATAIDVDAVISSESMFQPKQFRFEGLELVGVGGGMERRMALADIFALIRAMHSTVVEDTVKTTESRISLSRAMATGGLLMTKATTTESKRIATEREAVLYMYRQDGTPWLLRSTELRYEGLGANMQRSQKENFDYLLRYLRENAPSAAFDARLLNVRPSPNRIVATTSNHLAQSSSGTIDLLAFIVAQSLSRVVRPYR